MDKRIIAIIPARSGSKGLPDKNIRTINGKPLIAYSIETAKKSELFDAIHVSTDSEKYSQIATEFGADQPFLRDYDTSGDAASSWDVVREVLIKYKKIGQEFDICILLQPTSPLRTSEDIKNAFALFDNKGAKAVVSVTEVEHPIQWCFTLDESNSLQSFAKSKYKNVRRQDLEKNYRENGAIYIVNVKDILNPEFDIYESKCYAYVMDRNKSVDIDTLIDFKFAELLIQTDLEAK